MLNGLVTNKVLDSRQYVITMIERRFKVTRLHIVSVLAKSSGICRKIKML
jgi:hypothetical protein